MGTLKHFKGENAKLEWETDDCADNDPKDFPATGDYAAIPQFATPKLQMIKSGENAASEVKADTCLLSENVQTTSSGRKMPSSTAPKSVRISTSERAFEHFMSYDSL